MLKACLNRCLFYSNLKVLSIVILILYIGDVEVHSTVNDRPPNFLHLNLGVTKEVYSEECRVLTGL